MNKIIDSISRSAKELLDNLGEKQKEHYQSFSDLTPKDRIDVVISSLQILCLPIIVALIGTLFFDPLFVKLGIIIFTIGSVLGGVIELFSYLFEERKEFYRKLFIGLFVTMFIGGGIFGAYFGEDIDAYIENFNWQSDFDIVLYTLLWILSMAFAVTGLKYSFRTANAIYRQKLMKESEISFAKKVQEDLIPEISMDTERIKIKGQTMIPNELGGDFFDVLKVTESKYFLALGDVSGHNFGAGLLMAMLKSALVSHATHLEDIAEITRNLNKIIFEYSDPRMFATFTLVEVDLKKNTFKVVNAGHPPVIFVKNGHLIKSKPKGVGLGISKEAQFEIDELTLDKTDLLMLYSDGLVERITKENRRSDFADFEKLIKQLTSEQTKMPERLSFLQKGLYQHPEEFEDDATLLMLQVK